MKTNRIFGLIALAGFLALPEIAEAQFPGFGGTSGGGRTRGGTTSRTRGGGGSGNSAALQAQNKVVAVADERSNSLIILAPEDQIAMIEELINELDSDVDDVTEVKVVKLENADPTEVAEQINQLFGSQDQNQNQRFGPSAFFASRFGGGGTTQRGGNNNERGKRSTQEVVAVADPRTASIIISGPRQTIPTVEQLVKQLDSSSAKKQNVFVYNFEYADVNAAAEILRALFEGENTRNTTTQNQETALRNRAGTFGTAGTANAAGGGAGARGGGAGGIGGR
ncbi:MAG: secretin N-terminal domain-containing protein [Limisphaerales bacterium]